MATLVVPLYITNAQCTSLLTIVNTGSAPIDAVVTFWGLEGAAVGAKALSLAPRSSTTVDVGDVEMVEHRFPALGSISILLPSPRADVVEGYLTITSREPGNPFSVRESLQTTTSGGRLRVASVPDTFSVPVIAVHSLSDSPQTILLGCTDGRGQRYETRTALPAHTTFLLNVCIARRTEGRTYDQLLRGDAGLSKGAMRVEVKTEDGQGGISLWGFVRSVAGKPPKGHFVETVDFSDPRVPGEAHR